MQGQYLVSWILVIYCREGGQVVGQALAAASKTVPEEFVVHVSSKRNSKKNSHFIHTFCFLEMLSDPLFIKCPESERV